MDRDYELADTIVNGGSAAELERWRNDYTLNDDLTMPITCIAESTSDRSPIKVQLARRATASEARLIIDFELPCGCR